MYIHVSIAYFYKLIGVKCSIDRLIINLLTIFIVHKPVTIKMFFWIQLTEKN